MEDMSHDRSKKGRKRKGVDSVHRDEINKSMLAAFQQLVYLYLASSSFLTTPTPLP